MREIKFRVYDKKNKVMVTNENVRQLAREYDALEGDYELDEWYPYCNMYKVVGDLNILNEDKVIMEFTGLKDKNDKEIYEGDIIDIHQTVNGYNQFVVEWKDYGFGARYYNEKTKIVGSFYQYDLDALFEIKEYEKEIEVIGNIYEEGLGCDE